MNNAGMETFAQRLRQLRIKAKLTQEQLAHRCGYKTQSRISNYESEGPNSRLPSLEELPVLAEALRVRTSVLVDALPESPETQAEDPAVRPIFTKEQYAAEDVMALQIGLESLLNSILEHTPGAAATFLQDLRAGAKQHKLSLQQGLLAGLVDIADEVRTAEAEVAQVRRRAGSAARTKRGK